MDELRPWHTLGGILGEQQSCAGALRTLLGGAADLRSGPQLLRGDDAHVGTEHCAAHEQGIAHVVARVAEIGVAEGAVRGVLAHGEHVREHLRGVPLVGEPVVDGHIGVASELLDGRLLVAAVLDGIEHAREHPRRVGHGFLVADLGGLCVEHGDLGALLVRRDLKGDTGARGGLAEDQGDDSVLETAYLSAGLALGLEFSGEADQPVELRVGEVELPEQVASSEVHRTRLAGWQSRLRP